MPRTLFDQSIITRAKNRAPAGPLVASIVAHVLIVAAILVASMTGSVELPAMQLRVLAYLRPPAPELPALARPAGPAAPRSASAEAAPVVPMEMPDRISTDATAAPASFAPIPSGSGLAVGGSPLGTGTGPGVVLGPPPPPPPPPTPRLPIRIGGALRPPTRIAYTAPVYPMIARSARVEGSVVLEATLDETGAVTHVVVRESVPLLDRAAIEAVRTWRYTPTLLGGQPVPVILMVTVRFQLREGT